MNDASAIVFNQEAHSYTDTHSGLVLPSVTQVLSRLFDYSAVPPAVLAAKAALGTAVHFACELDDDNDLDEATIAPAVAPYLEAYRRFKREKLSRMVATERVVYNALGYAGKFDLLADIEGDRWLIDWKTPLSINPAVALQTAGYVGALPKELQPPPLSGGRHRSVRRAALQLKTDATYRLIEFKDPMDFPTFVSFLNTYNWMKRNQQ